MKKPKGAYAVWEVKLSCGHTRIYGTSRAKPPKRMRCYVCPPTQTFAVVN